MGVIEVDNETTMILLNYANCWLETFRGIKEHTANVLYENYRTEKLKRMGIEQDNTVFREFDPAAKQEEERALHEAKLAKMEAEMKLVFQQK